MIQNGCGCLKLQAKCRRERETQRGVVNYIVDVSNKLFFFFFFFFSLFPSFPSLRFSHSPSPESNAQQENPDTLYQSKTTRII